MLMWKRSAVICGKHGKFDNSKISYIFEKTLFLSSICSKCGKEDKKIFKKEESIDIIKNPWFN